VNLKQQVRPQCHLFSCTLIVSRSDIDWKIEGSIEGAILIAVTSNYLKVSTFPYISFRINSDAKREC
jgi:hypothetical protein